MDRAYKQDIPSVIKRLEGLRDAFATLDSRRTGQGSELNPCLSTRSRLTV